MLQGEGTSEIPWKWKLLSCVRLFATPQTIQFIAFSRPEYWVGSPSLLQGIIPTQGSNPALPHCRILYQLSHKGSPYMTTSHPYITTGKTKALTSQTFVSKVMFLLFNMLSRLVIAFPPRSKCLLILWLQSPSAVIVESPKIKSVTVFHCFPSICHEVMEPDAMILVF